MAEWIMQSLGEVLMLIGLGAAAGYGIGVAWFRASQRKMKGELQQDFDARIQKLEASLRQASAPIPAAPPTAVPAPPSSVPAPAVASPPATTRKEEVSPDTLLLIAAAVTAYLGKKVRIRSTRMLQSPYEIVNPWAQQGRVFVQASHNLARERD
jgi:hypothetical protein